MAGRGPAPKPVLQRESRTQAREDSSTKVVDDGVVRGPDLPAGNWPDQTLAWWNTWRTSPLAQTFGATDWDFLLDTALLHAEMWSGNLAVAPELRIRTAKFGATPEDRMRLKVSIETEVGTAKKASKAIPADRRRRLMSVVNGSS